MRNLRLRRTQSTIEEMFNPKEFTITKQHAWTNTNPGSPGYVEAGTPGSDAGSTHSSNFLALSHNQVYAHR